MHPTALPPLLCTELISYVLQQHSSPTTLIICFSREAFLHELQNCISQKQLQDLSPEGEEDAVPPMPPLLIPTLHLIAASQTVKLAFTPNLPHLRAYLAAYSLSTEQSANPPSPTRKGSRTPMLVVWGLANLHRPTAEHSAQGISRSLAVAVQASYLAGQHLVLVEPRQANVEESSDDTHNGMVSNPWREQVPLLSGSIRFGGDDRAWTGRTINIGRVVSKWCRFLKIDDMDVS